MNKTEFLNKCRDFYINCSNKNEALTLIYKFYLIHKKEIKITRAEIADYLGVNLNTFNRNYFRNRDIYFLPSESEIHLDSTFKIKSNYMADDSKSDDAETVVKKLIIQNRDILRNYNKLVRDDARVDAFKLYLKEQIEKLPNLDLTLSKDYQLKFIPNKTVEAIALLSDLHIGVNCDNFYNKYNLEIAKERLAKWVVSVANYCREFKVSRLNILNLGDMIHGLIHVSGRVEQEFDVVSQIITASELLANALGNLSTMLPNVEILYRSCTDNHSRAIPDYHSNIEKENFSRIIDWYLLTRLSKKNLSFIFDNIDESMGVFDLLNGETVGFAHGHQDNINTSFQNFIGATKQFINYVCLGHYHCTKSKSYQGMTVFVNGSIVGPEQYAISKRLFNDPTQLLVIFNGSDRLDVNINLK